MRVSTGSPRWKTSLFALAAPFSVLAVACGTGGGADTPRPSLKASPDVVQAAGSASITVDFPGATSTVGRDITPAGDAFVGEYDDAAGHHGFLMKGGTYTSINIPGAIRTDAHAINTRGDIVGFYRTPNLVDHGYLLIRDGFIRVDFPNAIATSVEGINDRGDIVGGYCDGTIPCPIEGHRGFLLSGGQFTSIDVPGASLTQAWKINARGDIVGVFQDKIGFHGFSLSKGVFHSIDFPGAVGTLAFGINRRGDIVGSYCTDKLTCGVKLTANHGFLLSEGEFVSFDVPGAQFTRAFAINPRGDIAGTYQDPLGRNHAFLLRKEDDEAGNQSVSGSGNWSIQLFQTSMRTSDGNLLIDFTLHEVITGSVIGTRDGTGRLVMHPDGTFDAQDCGTFVGSIGPSSGTATMCVVARGAGASIQGKVKVTDGAGGLAGVRGSATFTGSATGPLAFAGTYSSLIRFPDKDSSPGQDGSHSQIVSGR